MFLHDLNNLLIIFN
ncbi:hypothetical protein U9M48_025089 [Paspalum notatum var. saurae]|uniref:Uncharacterized protein n=1 Tax=Paspalum notatum var. saurae TaxID=547442 RepID=A0AAQ3TQ25_PASNO